MTKNAGNLSDEMISDIKDYFIANNIEMSDLARRSKELFGKKVGIETLRTLSDNDPGGSWYNQRQVKVSANLSYQEEIEMVRKVIFNNLMKPDTPASAVASLAKAWTDLSKNVENGRSSSAKTSPERGLELAKQALLELKLEEELDDPTTASEPDRISDN